MPPPWRIEDDNCYEVLNLGQFTRFMDVIKKLGDRVEKEHTQFLRDHQRIDDRMSTQNEASQISLPAPLPSFENLVSRGSAARNVQSGGSSTNSWDDDIWGTILSSRTEVKRFYFN